MQSKTARRTEDNGGCAVARAGILDTCISKGNDSGRLHNVVLWVVSKVSETWKLRIKVVDNRKFGNSGSARCTKLEIENLRLAIQQ